MHQRKFTPREDYRRQEARRTNESASLSETYRELKSLTVESGYFSPEGVPRNREIKCTFNLKHASSVFRLDCANEKCIGGDFDLSVALARAVAARQATATGEMCCQGWLNKESIHSIHCHGILRYKLTLAYE